MINIDTLFSTLMEATFAGLPFGVVDGSQETGRRVLAFLYPGVDQAGFQDLGLDDGPITVRGLLVGDDYIAQMQQFLYICRQPGPYTLVHPWFGTMQVVFQPGTKPKVTLANNELRVCRFEMVVRQFVTPTNSGLDTLSALEVSCDELVAQAQNWLSNALSPIATVLGAYSYVNSFLQGVQAGVQDAIATTSSAGVILAAAAGAIADLVIPSGGTAASWAGATASAMVAVPAVIEGACEPLVPSAVAPGGTSVAAAAADPADTCNTLLAAIPNFALPAGTPAPGPAISAALQAVFVANAVQAASRINYTSQQDAEAQAGLLYAAIDAAAVQAATAAHTDPADAAPVWRGLVSLRAALAADVNALIGRLPPVVSITTTQTMPAWVLAQYISGDTPSDVVATYRDLIARNNIFHPALVPPGTLEVLNQ